MRDYLCFKEINDLLTFGEVELARPLLMEAQSRCIALRAENGMLKLRIRALEDIIILSRNLFLEHGFYWFKTGGMAYGPYCPRCYDSDKILIKLEKQDDRRLCPYCGEVFIKQAQNIIQFGSRATILQFSS